MIIRIALIVATLVLVAIAIFRPAAHPIAPAEPLSQRDPHQPSNPFHHRGHRRERRFTSASSDGATIVYIVGAVRKPGLYHVHPGDRVADAVAMAGGLSTTADPAGINLAAHIADGDEIDAPIVGAVTAAHTRMAKHRTRKHRAVPQPPGASIDVNSATVEELSAVPGFGRTIAARIIEMREQDGAFTSLDELLDVAGLTESRLERARPFLQSF